MNELHDDLSPTDLKFLEKFGLLEEDKQQVDEAKPPEDFEAEDTLPGGGLDLDVGEPAEEEPSEPEAAPAIVAEAVPVAPAEEGEHTLDQTAEEEGIDMREGKAEAHAEESPVEAEGEEQLAEDGDGEPADDAADAESDEEAAQEPEEAAGEPEPQDEPSEPEEDQDGGAPEPEADSQDEPEPLAFDADDTPIFAGTKIRSQADGNFVGDDEEYVATVTGRWVGSADFLNDDPKQMILIVARTDGRSGANHFVTEENRTGWVTQSDLCHVVTDSEPEPEPSKPEQPYFFDTDGEPLHDGDQVIVVAEENFLNWPLEGVGLCLEGTRGFTITNPAVMPQNFTPEPDQVSSGWHTYDKHPVLAVGWGNTLVGIRKHVHVDEPAPQPEPTEPAEPPIEVEPQDSERKPMTKTQKDRFGKLAERIFAKSEATFGKTLDAKELGELLPGGIFDGEEVAQTLEIHSRGVVYRISLSAERVE